MPLNTPELNKQVLRIEARKQLDLWKKQLLNYVSKASAISAEIVALNSQIGSDNDFSAAEVSEAVAIKNLADTIATAND